MNIAPITGAIQLIEGSLLKADHRHQDEINRLIDGIDLAVQVGHDTTPQVIRLRAHRPSRVKAAFDLRIEELRELRENERSAYRHLLEASADAALLMEKGERLMSLSEDYGRLHALYEMYKA